MTESSYDAAKVAAEQAQNGADYVAGEVGKVEEFLENSQIGLSPAEIALMGEPIPSHYGRVDIAEARKLKDEANALAESAKTEEENAKNAENAGNAAEAEQAVQRAESARAGVSEIIQKWEEIIETAEVEEDEFGGPPNQEFSDPDNIYGFKD